MPPAAAITPPMMSACILYEKTFLPRARTASSSSRMPLITRPHGLRMSDQTSRIASASVMRPMMRTHHWVSLYSHGPKP